MAAQELNTYINRVLGNSIRCLLPSYWWKRLLTQIVEYVDEVKEKVDGIDVSEFATKDEVVNVGNGVSAIEQRLSNLYGFVITTGDKYNSDSSVWVDDDIRWIAPGTSQKVRFTNSFTLHAGYNIISIDTSLADTSQMTSMSEMFKGAEDLTSVDISTFDTSNVTDMSSMFSGCSSLISLPLQYFDMSNVENASSMFYNCSSLKMRDLRFFHATKVTDVSNMFNGCSNLGDKSSVYLYDLNTSHVTNMSGMFDGCDNLKWLYLGSNFFKMPLASVDLSAVSQWTESALIYSLVNYSYDRATNGLPTLEVKLHSTVYAYLTDEHKATLTSKGYIVTPVSQDPDNEE